jgi:presenilin-like A22 family membrane protease
LERKIGSRQILYILSLFLIAQIAGLLLTVLAPSSSYVYISATSTPTAGSGLSYLLLLAIELVIIVLVIMLVRHYFTFKGDLFLKLLEIYIVIFGSFSLFFVLISDLFATINTTFLSLISLLFAISVYAYKKKTNKLRNVVTLITCIGAGIIIGAVITQSYGFLILYLFFGFFAVYDYMAVFVLKFMIPFAKKAAEGNYPFMIGSSDLEFTPNKKKTVISEAELSKITNPKVKQLIKQGNVPIVSSIMLGNGDIILPLTLTVGSYVVYENIFLSMMIVTGSAVGLLFTIFLLRRYRIGLPAIPPLFTFISLALVIVFLIAKPFEPLMVEIFATASVLSFVAMIFTLTKIKRNTITA